MAELREFEAQLKEPFALDDIDFLPKGKIEKDGRTLCMALAYADPRVYQDRLNAIANGEWSTPAPVVVAVGNKLICYVTVILCGVPHTDVGEADPGENQGTEAFAQAFKRACSQFGLGRYLYDLEKEWVPFNPQKKQIDLDKAQRAAIVRKMYQKAGIVLAAPKSDGKSLHDLTKPRSYEQHHQDKAEEPKVAAPAQPQANGHQETEPQYPIEIIRLLSEFKELEPAWCNARPNWDRVLLTKVLDLQMLEPFPVIFDEDDINRVELYVESVRQKKAKAGK